MWKFLSISYFLIFGLLQIAETVNLRCYRGSLDKYEEASMDNPEDFISTGCIETRLTTVFFAFGYRSNPGNETTVAILKGLMSYKPRLNVILVNWDKESNKPANSTMDNFAVYQTVAVPNSKTVGQKLGKTLLKLSNYVNLMNTVLLGFSLGTHLVGYAGREVRNEGKDVWLIYAIDPANPIYNDPSIAYTPLNKASAKHVCCIHTDPWVYGTNTSECLSDVWLNYGNYVDGGDSQPGCPDRFLDGCSHSRGPFVALEAMTRPRSVLASGAPDYYSWVQNNGIALDIVDIGNFHSITRAVGNYYMTTNAAAPFARGVFGLKPPSSKATHYSTSKMTENLN